MTAWAQPNLWKEFLGETKTEFSSAQGFVPFSAELDESWIEAGAGASLQISSRTSLYGNVNYETTFDNDAWAESELAILPRLVRLPFVRLPFVRFAAMFWSLRLCSKKPHDDYKEDRHENDRQDRG